MAARNARGTLFWSCVLLSNVYVSHSLSSCNMTSGCSLHISSGHEVDFCPLFAGGNLIIHLQNETEIDYNGRSTVVCPGYIGQAICVRFAAESYLGLGNLNLGSMSCTMESENSKDKEYTFVVTYMGRQNIESRVTVVYSSDILDNFIYIPESEYNFELTTQKIVAKAIEPGVAGIVLILILLVSVLSYFLIGMLVNRFYKGARGIEMIPHLSFWRDFPYLLKDGFLFTFTGWPCCKKCFSSPATYNQL